MKQKQVEKTVKAILTEHPQTRNDDHCLYFQYVRRNGKPDGMTFAAIFVYYKLYGLPSFESVGRARRRVQQKCPELRGDKGTQTARETLEKEYHDYYSEE